MRHIWNDTKIAGVGQPNYRIPAYNIYYDARKTEDNGWEEPGYNDSGWENATEMGQAPCAPWNELYKRPIPLTKDYGLKEYLNWTSTGIIPQPRQNPLP